MKHETQGPSKNEWRFAIAVSIATTCLLQLPYLLGYLLARPGTEYAGLLINLEDFSYQAIMLQGYQGAWQYHIQFTPEPHPSAFLYGFYLALGHAARVLGLPLIWMWNIARVVAALALFLTAFGFISLFVRDPRQRRVAFLLAVFGSGLDWSILPFEQANPAGGVPVDFKNPDAHLFFAALTYPHLAIGAALILIEFWLWLKTIRDGHRHVILAGLVNVSIGIIYPFLMFLVGGVLATHWLLLSWRAKRVLWDRALSLVGIFIFALPLYAYYAYVLSTNAVFKTWDAQAVTLSPNPIHYLLAYGVMIVLVLLFLMGKRHLDWLQSAKENELSFLWTWIVVAALLLYAPLNAQRRFVLGLQVPLSILASAGLVAVLLPRLREMNSFRSLIQRRGYSVAGFDRMAIILLLALVSAANWVILAKLSLDAFEQTDAFYRPYAEVQSVEWLRGNTRQEEVVLAAYPTGSFIPARSGNAVFVGQRYETSHFADKFSAVAVFFLTGTEDEWRKSLLKQYGVRFVYAGERERNLGGFDPGAVDYLERVYANSHVSIYAFLRASEPE